MKISLVDRIILTINKFLIIKTIRCFVAYVRYIFLRFFLRKNKIISNKKFFWGKDTFLHNYKKVVHSIFYHDRVLSLIRPTLAIQRVLINKPCLKVLSIGPRSESELLLLAAHGFSWKNIRGLDLFSYSSKIDVGDMHYLPYKNDSFDIIFSGWSLGYSDKQKLALNEMVRVLKNSGIIAFGQGHIPLNERKQNNWTGAKVVNNKIDKIFSPISKNIDNFFFRHEIDKEMEKRGERAILAVFSIKK
tara:strand:- start:774 stop:1511 length:738 start_codon:yes stop_codon:yes gene_type:complete